MLGQVIPLLPLLRKEITVEWRAVFVTLVVEVVLLLLVVTEILMAALAAPGLHHLFLGCLSLTLAEAEAGRLTAQAVLAVLVVAVLAELVLMLALTQ
jgi:hypothetical protein